MCKNLRRPTRLTRDALQKVNNVHEFKDMVFFYDNFNEGDFCPNFCECIGKVLARYIPSGSLMLQVPTLMEDDKMPDKMTVLEHLVDIVYHEHQTDDGALWEFGEALLQHLMLTVQTPDERKLLSRLMWDHMRHN